MPRLNTVELPSPSLQAKEDVNCFVLLDDCDATDEKPLSRLYTHFSHARICTDPNQWESVCNEVDRDLRAGWHAVILADYEWGVRAQLALTGKPSTQALSKGTAGAFQFLLFDNCAHLSRKRVDLWLAQQDAEGAILPTPVGIVNRYTSVSHTDFSAAFSKIQAALRAGDVYQVNYTYQLNFSVFGSPFALYRRLRHLQPTRYGALIAQPDDRWIISCSPELFLHHQTGRIIARPMKGTAGRAHDAVADAHAAADLAVSTKNRAENLMIVDLLRNDLSRVAKIGSVRVPRLLSVEPYPTVWQMTSMIEAQLAAQASFAKVIRALFPCGSITGAPKQRAMQYISALEKTPRGLYTGAIGWLDAPTSAGKTLAHRCGDFCLSVAIRTLTLNINTLHADGWRDGHLGVGAGIVSDSEITSEQAECGLKADFLRKMDPGFALIETMYATRQAGIRHLKRHWRRLRAAARQFDFRWDPHALWSRLNAYILTLPSDVPFKLRLVMDKTGHIQLSSAALKCRLTEPVSLLLAPNEGYEPVAANNLWLRYKTTLRTYYDHACHEAKRRGAFDMLFFNTRGELTEGARSNVFVKVDGRWLTPPTTSGLLPGVMRAVLLNDPTWKAAEQILTRTDLQRAQRIIVCNALHGAIEAKIIEKKAVQARVD